MSDVELEKLGGQFCLLVQTVCEVGGAGPTNAARPHLSKLGWHPAPSIKSSVVAAGSEPSQLHSRRNSWPRTRVSRNHSPS